MRLSNLLRIAFTALQRNRLRAFLTMLGVIIGVASVIVMLAIGEGSKQSIRDQISSMGSNMLFVQPGSDQRGGVQQDFTQSQTLTLNDLNALIKNADYLSDISPQVSGNGQAIYSSKNWPTSVYGVSPAYLGIRKLSVTTGSMFTDKDVASAAKVVVIGKTVVENLFGNESPIGKTIRFNKIPFRVIGVLAEKGQNTFGQDQDDIIIAPYTTVQKRILAATHLQSITASVKSEEVVEKAIGEIETILRSTHKLKDSEENNFTVRSQQELISTFSSTSEMMTILLVVIASISLVIGGIGIMNIMYVSVTERTREIGLRMAVGGRGKDILMQFLLEAILISITGGVLGVTLGLGSTYVVSNYLNWPVVITINSMLISFTVCALTGIFFGWYPARKAAAADPIVALRYE